jgi:acetyl-CoA acyltransferase
VDLHAHAIGSLVERADIDPGCVDDVIGGAVGQSSNTTRGRR